MFCRKCGTKNPDDARFCRNCGTPMSSGPSVNGGGSVNGGQNGNPIPPPMGQPGAMPRKPKGKRNGAMIAIVAVVVVALIASAVLFYPGNWNWWQKLRRYDRRYGGCNE